MFGRVMLRLDRRPRRLRPHDARHRRRWDRRSRPSCSGSARRPGRCGLSFCSPPFAGIAVSGWNGVQIAEVARRSPPELIGETAAGAVILIFTANMLTPVAFAAFVAVTGRYDLAFLASGAFSLICLPLLYGIDRGPRKARSLSRTGWRVRPEMLNPPPRGTIQKNEGVMYSELGLYHRRRVEEERQRRQGRGRHQSGDREAAGAPAARQQVRSRRGAGIRQEGLRGLEAHLGLRPLQDHAQGRRPDARAP